MFTATQLNPAAIKEAATALLPLQTYVGGEAARPIASEASPIIGGSPAALLLPSLASLVAPGGGGPVAPTPGDAPDVGASAGPFFSQQLELSPLHLETLFSQALPPCGAHESGGNEPGSTRKRQRTTGPHGPV